MGLSNDMAMLKNVAKENNAFNASEAQKNRDFQKSMSDTAHQREVNDLVKAGLNPVLSAGGQGSSTPSGDSADADTNITGALASMLKSQMDNNAALQRVQLENDAALQRAQIQASAAVSAAQIQASNAWAMNEANLKWQSDHPSNPYQLIEEILGGAGLTPGDVGKWVKGQMDNGNGKKTRGKGKWKGSFNRGIPYI